jgi:hypothetical protein
MRYAFAGEARARLFEGDDIRFEGLEFELKISKSPLSSLTAVPSTFWITTLRQLTGNNVTTERGVPTLVPPGLVSTWWLSIQLPLGFSRLHTAFDPEKRCLRR